MFHDFWDNAGLSPEGRRVFPRMTVLENLEIGAFSVQDRTIVQEQIEKVFKLFPVLKERWKQKAGTLSGGEQQMLAIGRALMARPKLLLLDEPSLGLAPIMVQRIAEAILSLKREGISILLVEQNANIALQIADRGYLIQNGEVVLEGRAKDLIVDSRVKKVYLGVAN
ncbi:ABC transporter ATP-binding protein [Thermanaeromonas sp. C210]|uniref:ABC transporter ATP-binding protein n=1 Tax=Thermanaeromonas sp. C210 TaxID=2731925 RepID=UPI0021103294|nr:ABC transporter ATP-binding protein [Thermanaeromonas sp. C210]